ncbi:unnamed protein product [Brachionus calyciflorus]|uniref:FLYWCH-type domain-containing protein n=1 Tax=Brachionus calyciflorus TaxID=104777 RepID=A0A813V739_9BILA|nr:unnamed protein product [Brachionus calyciflorus]
MTSIEDLTDGIRNIGLNQGFITLSQKGKPQLHYDSYFYRQNGKPTKHGKFNWRCIVNNCTASCSTYSNCIGVNVLIAAVNNTHQHSTSPTKLAKLERRRIIGVKATMADEKPRKILNDYIQDNYVGKFITQKIGRGRGRKEIQVFKEAQFPIKLWNVNQRTHESIPRTNNFVESWHKAFSNMLNKHPLIYSLINSFISEQKRVESSLLKLKTGIEYKRKPKYVLLDNRIKSILKSYDKNNIEEILIYLSLLMKY